jgi:hypothetical protein
VVRAALAMTALALAAAGAMLIWSQAWLGSTAAHASLGGAAFRSAAEPYMTGPGIPLRPEPPAAANGQHLEVTLAPPAASTMP